jgi:hypothetical protein
MSVDGRVVLDALVHDTTGSVGLNVISLTASKGCTGGRVALLEGTAGTDGVTLPLFPCTYRDSTGAFVSFETLTFAVVLATSGDLILTRYRINENNEIDTVEAYLGSGDSMVASLFGLGQDNDTQYPISVRSVTGTASYKVMVYGS